MTRYEEANDVIDGDDDDEGKDPNTIAARTHMASIETQFPSSRLIFMEILIKR